MEKKLFGFFIPLCIIGFLGFWISTMFFGTVPITEYGVFSVKDSGENSWSFTRSIKSENFSAEMIANPNIELYLADVHAVVESYNGVNINVEVKNTSNSQIKVTLNRLGDDTTSIRIENDSIFNFGFGLFNINFGGFDGGSINRKQVVIKVPNKFYDNVKIVQGSGKSEINGIDAYKNDIDIGSGEFSFSKNKNFTSDSFNIDLGSGKATFTGMAAKKYDIDIGSGELNASGIRGTGDIDMGSGNAHLSFDESPKGSLDMGSGYMKMELPYIAMTTFKFDIGSGTVEINTEKEILLFGHLGAKEYQFGYITPSAEFSIGLGSGKVDIGYQGFTPGAVSSQTSYAN